MMQFALVTFASVLFIVDPIAVVPTFIMGLLLAAIAVQFVITGIREAMGC